MSTNFRTVVFSKLMVEALHSWPSCNIDSVSYLRYPHRHLFHFVAYKPVYHDDRDIEFIDFQHQMKKYIYDKYWDQSYSCCNFGSQSCEMLGRELMLEFGLTKIEVNEDNENGAILTV